MPTEVISTVLPDGSKKIDLKIGLYIRNFLYWNDRWPTYFYDPRKAFKARWKNEAKVYGKICLFLANSDVSITYQIWLNNPMIWPIESLMNTDYKKSHDQFDWISYSVLRKQKWWPWARSNYFIFSISLFYWDRTFWLV